MSQLDFAYLAIQNQLADEILCIDEADEDDISVGKQDVALTQAEYDDVASREEYIPVNFFPDDVYAFVEAWDSSNLTTTTSYYPMHMNVDSVPVSQDMFEPIRRLNLNDVLSPPKPFYRTFWRSASRRILSLSSAQKE